MERLLYVMPHCSTGGMPAYLLKKVELLKNIYDIFVVEYNHISADFVVQRKQLQKILNDKFITLTDNKFELLSIISDINPSIVHLEELPEYFMDFDVAKDIYKVSRKYSIIETTHDSSFDISKKMFFPDKFAFVSDFSMKQFAPLEIPMELVEYPIEFHARPNRTDALQKLGQDPTYKHVLNVGLFTSRKNQAEIFNYANALIDKKILFHFVGNLADNFKEYWEPLLQNKPDNCIIWGERSDVDLFYSSMDLFLFTSKGCNGDKETNPLVIKEALSWQMPVLLYPLDVYQGKYDDNSEVLYLQKDVYLNTLLIQDTLKDETIDSKPQEIYNCNDLLSKYRIIDNSDDEFFSTKITAVNRLYGLRDLLDFCNINKESIVVEIGSYAGVSSALLATYAKNVYCCDIWESYINPPERATMVKAHFNQIRNTNTNITPIVKPSNEASRLFADNSLDMVYIDADHSYESVYKDILLWLPKVKQGGIIAGHDYHMGDVVRAVTDIFPEKFITVFSDSSWCVRNNTNELFTPITVIIPTFNRNELLTDAIDSVIKQQYPNITVRVCHDGPSDQFENYKYSNDNVIFSSLPMNHNDWGATSRNTVTASVPDDNWIIYLDDDNILYPKSLFALNKEITPQYGMIVPKIELDGFGWYNLVLPKTDAIIPSEIDALNLCVNAKFAKQIFWDSEFGQDYRFILHCADYCQRHERQILFSDTIIGKHRCIQKSPTFIFSHNYLVNNWKDIVENQLSLIKSSGLGENVDKIFFTVIDNANEFDDFKNLALSYINENKCEFTRFTDNNYEFDTLNAMRKFAKSQYNNGNILYIHTKGVVSAQHSEYNPVAIEKWRTALEQFNIGNWKECIELLKSHDVVGTYFFEGENGRSDIFAGNFWWANMEYISTLPELSYQDRGECETWLFANNPTYYNNYTPKNKGLYYVSDDISDIVVVSAHPNYKRAEEVTLDCIRALQKAGKKVILTSHTSLSKELQDASDYCVFDKTNVLVEHNYFTKSWWNTDDYYAEVNLTKNGNNMNHACGVANNYYNGVLLAKSLNYDVVHCINFDIIIDENDYHVLDDIKNQIVLGNKEAYFMNTIEQEGNTYKTIYFATKPKFFLDNFRYYHNSNEYMQHIRDVGCGTNCLENFYYHVLNKHESKMCIQETTEELLFPNSNVNLFSMIEYFTVLPTENTDEFVIWYSSSNKVDGRWLYITLDVNGETETVAPALKIEHNHIFKFKSPLGRYCTYKVNCRIVNEEHETIKDKTIEFKTYDDIKDNGIYRTKRHDKHFKFKAIHLLTAVDTEREQRSIASISQLAEYGIEYVQIINPIYGEHPPKENCARPDAIAENNGYYKLTPPHYGCYLAHKNGILNNFSDDIDALLVFECDAIINMNTKDFVGLINDAYQKSIENDLLMWTFGPHYGHVKEDKGNYVILEHFVECHSYMIPSNKREIFINTYNTAKWDVTDLFYINEFHNVHQGAFKSKDTDVNSDNVIPCVQAKGFSLLDNKMSSENIIGIKKI